MILQITLATRTEEAHSDDAIKTEYFGGDSAQEFTEVKHPNILFHHQ